MNPESWPGVTASIATASLPSSPHMLSLASEASLPIFLCRRSSWGLWGYYLRELPVKLHSLGFGVTALNEPWPTVDIHQAPVVIIVNCGAQDAHVDLLSACVVHILGMGEGRGSALVTRELAKRSQSIGLQIIFYCSG